MGGGGSRDPAVLSCAPRPDVFHALLYGMPGAVTVLCPASLRGTPGALAVLFAPRRVGAFGAVIGLRPVSLRGNQTTESELQPNALLSPPSPLRGLRAPGMLCSLPLPAALSAPSHDLAPSPSRTIPSRPLPEPVAYMLHLFSGNSRQDELPVPLRKPLASFAASGRCSQHRHAQ